MHLNSLQVVLDKTCLLNHQIVMYGIECRGAVSYPESTGATPPQACNSITCSSWTWEDTGSTQEVVLAFQMDRRRTLHNTHLKVKLLLLKVCDMWRHMGGNIHQRPRHFFYFYLQPWIIFTCQMVTFIFGPCIHIGLHVLNITKQQYRTQSHKASPQNTLLKCDSWH